MKNKVVIITGGSLGIGRGLAFEFGRAGAKIVITGRNEQNLLDTASDLKKEGIECLAIVSDVSIEADNKSMVEQTIQKYGQIDILINNAGMSMRSDFLEADTKVFRQLMDINYFGMVYATKFALPYIVQTKGSVLAISSVAGIKGVPERTGYSASKFAMNGFMEALRIEMFDKGVHVLTVCPGYTQSNIRMTSLKGDGTSLGGESMLDEGKMMTAEEAARRTLKATVQRKRELIMTRDGKLVKFLNYLFPSWVDQIVYKRELVKIRQLKKEKQNA
jgi:dehydrogenase/reductase SDR family member 7B